LFSLKAFESCLTFERAASGAKSQLQKIEDETLPVGGSHFSRVVLGSARFCHVSLEVSSHLRRPGPDCLASVGRLSIPESALCGVTTMTR
jgi:hypothetical protein